MLVVLLLVISAAFLAVSPVSALEQGNIGVMVNNKQIFSGSSTSSYNSVLMVPALEYVQSLGGTFIYDHSKMTGSIQIGGNELLFNLDDSIASFNGKYIKSTAPMKIINNRFMIPAEFTAASFGAECRTSASRGLLMVFQPVNGKLVYKVMSGDTLWIISQLFGTTIASLRQLNNITGDMIYIGQSMVIRDLAPKAIPVTAYTTANATIFSGAGFNYSAVNYLKAGTEVVVTGKTGPWYKAVTPKGNGYLYDTVMGMKQELSPGSKSTFFNNNIYTDTSRNRIDYIDYTVQRGDSIWAISQKYGIPDYELAQANGITAYTTLYPNQNLKIPVHVIPSKSTPGAAYGEVLDWFKEASYVFPIGKTGKLTDIATGKSFYVKRTMGANHSDTETLTAGDTEIMKSIFGGWNWNRRPFILEADGRRLAVSVAGMPHAGVDALPYMQNVDNRSDNWGTGPNYDSIKGNGMDGHFDLYFLNCIRHADNKTDPAHQYNVMLAGGLR